LDRHQIEYGLSNSTSSIKGFSYKMNKMASVKLSNNDLVVNTDQPKSNLIKALFEPNTKIADSLTYDITAWALPHSRGLDAYAMSSKIATTDVSAITTGGTLTGAATPYAYLSKWNSIDDVEFLGHLLRHNIKVRFSKSAFSVEGKNYKAGSLVITRRGNEKLGTKFDEIIKNATKKFNRDVYGASTGFVSSGKDFGSSSVAYVKPPKVALLSGKGVSSLSFGSLWHFFEQQIQYPVSVLDTDYFGDVNLNKYDVLILPNGYYSSVLSKEKLKKVTAWVQAGGRLIAIDRALSTFAKSKEFSLSNFKDDAEKKEKEKVTKALKEKLELEAYDNLERKSISNLITGSVFNATMDNTHPLGFGFEKQYQTLRLNGNHYAYLKSGVNVSVIKSIKDQVSGFAGANALKNVERSLVFGVESKGRGEVVYLADDPLFRSFWENGKLVFCNAVFLVGQ